MYVEYMHLRAASPVLT